MSAFFVCFECDCVDQADLVFDDGIVPPQPEAQLCSECRCGQWHGDFPKTRYVPGVDIVSNRPTGIGLG